MPTWTYKQSTGQLFQPDGAVAGKGYAGKDAGRNNPAQQSVRDVGPIPQGKYVIGTAIPKHPMLGPIAIPLTPDPANTMFGRSHFYMHGDNATHTASLGCIIQGPTARKKVAADAGKTLQVIA